MEICCDYCCIGFVNCNRNAHLEMKLLVLILIFIAIRTSGQDTVFYRRGLPDKCFLIVAEGGGRLGAYDLLYVNVYRIKVGKSYETGVYSDSVEYYIPDIHDKPSRRYFLRKDEFIAIKKEW